MKLSARRILMIVLGAMVLTLTIATTIWFGAIGRWVLHELHARAAALLHPTLSIEELHHKGLVPDGGGYSAKLVEVVGGLGAS
jgi:hypothetical protein